MAAATKTPALRKKRPLKKQKLGVRPLEDRVIVKIDEAETESPGGIILPAAAQEQSQFGTVVAVGPGKPWVEYHGMDNLAEDPILETPVSNDPLSCGPRFPMTVTEGTRVIIGRFAGVPIELAGHSFTIMRETDVIAVVDPPEE